MLKPWLMQGYVGPGMGQRCAYLTPNSMAAQPPIRWAKGAPSFKRDHIAQAIALFVEIGRLHRYIQIHYREVNPSTL